MTNRTGKRADKISRVAEGRPSAGTPMPVEPQTPNPLPDKDYSQKQKSFGDDEAIDPENEDQ